MAVSFDDEPHVAPFNYSSVICDHGGYGSPELQEAQALRVDLPLF